MLEFTLLLPNPNLKHLKRSSGWFVRPQAEHWQTGSEADDRTKLEYPCFFSHFNVSNHYQSHPYNFVNLKQLILLHHFIKKRIRVTGAVYFVFVSTRTCLPSSNVLRCFFRFILSRCFHFFLLIRLHVVKYTRHSPP